MYAVNHNGTEDWVSRDPAPEYDLIAERDEGRALFDTVEDALAFARMIALDALRWVSENSSDPARALRDVPVQIVDASTDQVIAEIEPDLLMMEA